MIRIAKIIMLLMFLSIQSLVLVNFTVAQDTIKDLATTKTDGFQLIPKATDDTLETTYQNLAKDNGGNRHQFWDAYNKKAKEFGDTGKVGDQLATGVMNWDTIIAYSGIVITFISNLGLVVGAGFIIYSGYQYAMSAFGTKEDNGKAIKNAFIGIAVIATSYGIFRLLARIFIE